MRVFVDYHHNALYYSFHLLFEKRLGWELYSPIGYEWFWNGYWRYSSKRETIEQYLGKPTGRYEVKDGIYYIEAEEGTNRFVRKAVTLSKFMEMEWDYIIASVYNHERPYHELARIKKACFIRQMGNPGERCDFNLCRNILNSTRNPVPPHVNQVFYHPEFDVEKDYFYEPPRDHRTIRSFMNCLPLSKDAPLFYRYEKALPEFKFRMHGILGRDGLLSVREVPEAMRNSAFIWHLKSQGDGYGFVVHQAMATGRPLILKKSYYRGQTAEPLFVDDETCIDLDGHSFEENIERIRYWSEPGNHEEMCLNAHRRFKRIVDFNGEFKRIKEFLNRINPR